MRNLADVIENFIVGELLTEGNQYVLVQRNELAEKAHNQIGRASCRERV